MKKIVGILLIIVIVAQTSIITAASKQELENQQKENEENIKEIQSNIDDIQEEKSAVMKEVENLINQIATYQSELDDLNIQMSDLENKIKQTEDNISAKEQEYKEQKELSDKILVAIYEQGDTTYLDVLLSSASIVDFISRYYLVTELSEYNVELLKTIDNQKEEIENEKAELENNKRELEKVKTEKETKYNELKTIQQQKNSYAQKLTAQEKEEQKELEKFKEDQRNIANELREIQENDKQNNNGGNISYTPSESGYIFPVQGLSKANINNKTYPSYPGHTGVDININVIGKNVVAVKDGTVAISRAISGSIKNYDSNGNYIGSYSSYGEYIVINHHDGTMTLYGHMKPGSRRVTVGQEVKQGQVIGTVGNTGNCSPRPTPSNPFAGTHLHFEVRINGKAVNPLPYLP